MGFSTTAKFYIGGFICAGFSLLVSSMLHWASADQGRFVAYFLLTSVAACMKVRLGDIPGTLSVSYILVLSGLVQFSLSELVAISVVSALVQCFWKATPRPSLAQVSFNISLMVFSGALAYAIYQAWPPQIRVTIYLTDHSVLELQAEAPPSLEREALPVCPAPWRWNPYRLVSLLDLMKTFAAHGLLSTARGLQNSATLLFNEDSGLSAASRCALVDSFTKSLREFRELCEA